MRWRVCEDVRKDVEGLLGGWGTDGGTVGR